MSDETKFKDNALRKICFITFPIGSKNSLSIYKAYN